MAVIPELQASNVWREKQSQKSKCVIVFVLIQPHSMCEAVKS